MDGRGDYWQAVFGRAACAAMIAKYEALAALEALPRGALQDARLRRAARRWPGCLRESQLAGPVHCAARLAHARGALDGDPRARAIWREGGAAAVPLWADLHALLADQLRFRAAGGGPLAAFVASVASTGRWPARADELEAVAGARIRPRQAYRWLAAQAGLALPELNFILFAREGPWDHRP